MKKQTGKKKSSSVLRQPEQVQWFLLPSDSSSEPLSVPVWSEEALKPEAKFIAFVRKEAVAHIPSMQKQISGREEDVLYLTGKRAAWKEPLSDLLSGAPLSLGQHSALVFSRKALDALVHLLDLRPVFDDLSQKVYQSSLLPSAFVEVPALKSVQGNAFRFAAGSMFKVQTTSSNSGGNAAGYKWSFWIISLLMLIVMPWMSRDAGITGDEFTQHEFSDMVIDYFTKGDTAALYQPKTLMHFYGSSFDTFSNVIIRAFKLEHIYEARHVINSLFGFLAILFTGLLAMRLSDWRTGIVALLFLFFMPRFLGHTFNNPKDVPFALGYIMSLYYTIKLFRTYPVLPMRTVSMLVLSLALGMSIRVGGLLSFAYVFVMLGFAHIEIYGLPSVFKDASKRSALIRAGIVSLIACVAAWILGILPWPYGLQAPIQNPLNALKEFSSFSAGIRQLFEGQNTMSTGLPKYYLLKYLYLTTPLVIMLGVALFLLLNLNRLRMKNWNAARLMLLFALVFPITYIFYKGSNVYGGLRHVLFILTPMAVIAALGFRHLLLSLGNKKWALPFAALLVIVGLSFPVLHVIKNHPYQYIYYNELSGGMDKVYGQYELDYYHHSHKEATAWLVDYLNKNNAWGNKEKPVIIASNFSNATSYYLRKEDPDQFTVAYSRYYEKNQNRWDYFIMNNTYINAFHVKNGMYPPYGTIHTINLDGKPICAIIKRTNYDDVDGFDLFKAGNYPAALQKFDSYLILDPSNSSVLNAVATCYLMLGQQQQAASYAQQAVQYYPDYIEAHFTLGRVQLNQGQLQAAISTFDFVLRDSPSSFGAWYMKAYAQYFLKDYSGALQSLEQCLQYNQQFKDAYILGATIYEAQGNMQQAERLRSMAAQF